MASLINIRDESQEKLGKYMAIRTVHQNVGANYPIIAKGNIIEGIEAEE